MRFLTSRRILGALALLATAGLAGGGRRNYGDSDKVAAQVRVLNIVNQLNLTAEQLGRVLPIVREDVAEREALEQRREAAEPELMAAATRLRTELEDGFHTSPDAERAWERVHGPLFESFLDYRQQRERRVDAVMQILSPNQLALIARYKPCVVPIKDYKDPARVGQSAASSRVELMLDRVRQMPEGVFQDSKERIHRVLEDKLRFEYSYDQIPAKVAETEQAFLRIRAMSEVEYQAKKSIIAEQLAPAAPPATGRALRERVGEFLMSPEALPILEHRRTAAQAR